VTVNPYPAISNWVIPAAAIDETIAAVQRGARRGTECGVFWLGRRAETTGVTTLVVPVGPGVVERADRWEVSPEVLGKITSWASPKSLVMLGMVHTHGATSVLLSPWDRYRTIQVPGILSVIIGNGGRDRDPADWGWYLYDTGAYRDFPLLERRQRITMKAALSVSVYVACSERVTPLVRG
jgi:hypothetical protein